MAPKLKPVGADREPSGSGGSISSSQSGSARLVLDDQEEKRLRARVEEALSGHGLDPASVGRAVTEVAQLRRDVNLIQGRLLDAGRHLIRLQKIVGEGGYKALHEAGLVPFPESTASQLRTVAAAVDGQRLPIEHMPKALGAAVIAARLPEPSRQLLIKQGVIRPDVTVKEMRDAVREPAPTIPPHGRKLTPNERRRLERRAQRLRAELARIEARLGQP